MRSRVLVLALGLLLLVGLASAACGDDDGGPSPDAAIQDAAVTLDASALADAAPDAAVVDPTQQCVALGLPSRPWVDAADDPSLYAVAADLTLTTTEGPYGLKAGWTGCDVHLFIQDVPRQNAGFDTPLWSRDLHRLLLRAPANTRFFFVSTSADVAERDAALADLRLLMEDELSSMHVEESLAWRRRIHYLTDRARDLPGWLGAAMASPGWGMAIDRFQRLRYLGSYADYQRYDANAGWFAPNLAMVDNEPIYYNFEADRQARLDAQDALVIPVFDGAVIEDPGWTGARGYADVDLPSATAMAGHDSLELDLALGCGGAGEFGECPAWDYLVYLYLCDADQPDRCDLELGRWITTYHREGRWVHDVSALLPLLAGGGTRRLAFYTTQPYTVTLSLRLFSSAKPERPEETYPLFQADVTFDASYNEAFDATTLFIPGDAVKVEIASVITGHGMSPPDNCAEFCNTEHTFTVNGVAFTRDFPWTEVIQGCMDQVREGTVPNQYGTWWYGRGGWCPGKEVQVHTFDVTAAALLGADNTFDYQGLHDGAPYSQGTDWRNIRVASWVVISR
jgi:hypothetical protein